MELILEQSADDLDAGVTGAVVCPSTADAVHDPTDAATDRKATRSMEQLRAPFPSFAASSFVPPTFLPLPPAELSASDHAASTAARVQQQQQEQLPFSSPSTFFSLLPLPDMLVEPTLAATNSLAPSVNTSAQVPERAPDVETAHFNACLYALTQIQQQEQMQTPSFPVPQSAQGGSTRQQRRGAVSERGLDALTIACLSQYPLPQAPPLQYPLPEAVSGSLVSQDRDRVLSQPNNNGEHDRNQLDQTVKRLNAEYPPIKPSKQDAKKALAKKRHEKTPSQASISGDTKRASSRAEELFEFLRLQYSSSAGITTPSRASDNAPTAPKKMPKHNRSGSSSGIETTPPTTKGSTVSLSTPSVLRRKSTSATGRKNSGEAARAANRTSVGTKDEAHKEDKESSCSRPERHPSSRSKPAANGPAVTKGSGVGVPSVCAPKRPFAVGSLVVFWAEQNGFSVKLSGRVEQMSDNAADIQVLSRSGVFPHLPVSSSIGAGSETIICHRNVPFQNILAFDQAHALNLSG